MMGLLLWLAAAGYAGAFSAALLARRGRCRAERIHPLFAAGFTASVAAMLVHWLQAGHLPLTNVLDVLAAVAACGYPAWRFYRRHSASLLLPLLTSGMALLLVLGPAARAGAARPLSPMLDSPWFIPHIAAYMLAYALCLLAAGCAVAGLRGNRDEELHLADRCARHAFPLLTFGLLAGAFWAQTAWGDYWRWDPKEIWALITWLVYAAALHEAAPRRRAWWYVGGVAAILMTLFAVSFLKLFAGLHSYG